MDLNEVVRRYVVEARKSPALAVGAALDELEKASQQEFEGAFSVNAAGKAEDTWMARAQLLAANAESEPAVIPLGGPIEIVGFYPTVLAIEAGKDAPPLEAIDVMIELNRGRRILTHRAENNLAAADDQRVVNLPMISSAVANRLIGLRVTGFDPTLTFKFRWAVDVATVAALGWSNAQVSVGIFIKELEG